MADFIFCLLYLPAHFLQLLLQFLLFVLHQLNVQLLAVAALLGRNTIPFSLGERMQGAPLLQLAHRIRLMILSKILQLVDVLPLGRRALGLAVHLCFISLHVIIRFL